ncbi:MAG: TIM barrel protein [Planctomycetes bacterium]|nr:TIM barrel protein [Planctomycetota bacterium]
MAAFTRRQALSRGFAAAGAAAGAALLPQRLFAQEARSASAAPAERPADFTMRFAPHFGMFHHHAGDDAVAQLEFMRAQGFTALEDNGMAGRSPAEQERIGAALDRLGMTMGVFVANMSTAFGRPTFASGDAAMREEFLESCRNAVDVAKRCGAKWMTVVLGDYDHRFHPEVQTAHAIESLKRAAAIFEPHGLSMVLEPLNELADHPGLFLTRSTHAYLICKAVASPACKILFDAYHQQITEGNLVPNIEQMWDEIAYYQIGDNPGRCEPGTGEVNWAFVFRRIKERGFTGVLGMEHGKSRDGKEGEQALIAAYRACDPR